MSTSRAFEIMEDLVSPPFVLLLAAFVGVVAGLVPDWLTKLILLAALLSVIVSAYIVMRAHDERAGGLGR